MDQRIFVEINSATNLLLEKLKSKSPPDTPDSTIIGAALLNLLMDSALMGNR